MQGSTEHFLCAEMNGLASADERVLPFEDAAAAHNTHISGRVGVGSAGKESAGEDQRDQGR